MLLIREYFSLFLIIDFQYRYVLRFWIESNELIGPAGKLSLHTHYYRYLICSKRSKKYHRCYQLRKPPIWLNPLIKISDDGCTHQYSWNLHLQIPLHLALFLFYVRWWWLLIGFQFAGSSLLWSLISPSSPEPLDKSTEIPHILCLCIGKLWWIWSFHFGSFWMRSWEQLQESLLM